MHPLHAVKQVWSLKRITSIIGPASRQAKPLRAWPHMQTADLGAPCGVQNRQGKQTQRVGFKVILITLIFRNARHFLAWPNGINGAARRWEQKAPSGRTDTAQHRFQTCNEARAELRRAPRTTCNISKQKPMLQSKTRHTFFLWSAGRPGRTGREAHEPEENDRIMMIWY